MQPIFDFWNALDFRKQVIVVLSTLVVFAAVLGLSRLASTPSYSLLYSGLEPAASGEVVTALEQTGVPFEVRGSSIFVDATQRDELRMMLASQGLPMTSGKGYELLDGLSGFGTTAQMFDAAYWRAKEGELARTIQSSSYIKSARVHIANTTKQPFRPAETASASVTAVANSGGLSVENATAMRYLVASAVAGLSPASVTVVDGRTGAVVGGDDLSQTGTNASDRASELRRNILRLLEARVGVGHAVVEVNVETVSETEAISEHRVDPESRVPVSSETEESTNSASGSGTSAITVASNLPEGDASGGSQNSNSQGSKTRETVNYDFSETRREVVRNPGAVRRISVAVIVDGIMQPDAETGESVWQPRPEAEIEALRTLVASAMGFDEARGDQLTLQNLQLTLPEFVEQPAEYSLIEALGLDIMKLVQIAVLALVSLVLGLFVLRPILTRAPLPNLVEGNADTAALLPMPPAANDADAAPAAGGGLPELPMMPMATMAIGNGAMDAGGAEDPVERLRNLIEERQDEAVQILEGWMTEEGETA